MHLKKILCDFKRAVIPDEIRFKKFVKHHGLSEPYKIHVGCGQNVLSGWINIDLSQYSKYVFVLDVRNGVPTVDETVKYIFSEHFLEHLTKEESKCFSKKAIAY